MRRIPAPEATLREAPLHAPTAHVDLWGYPARPAHLQIHVSSLGARLIRTVSALLLWASSTALTFVLTFDPFLVSFPLTIGAWGTWRSWRGRFRIHSFEAGCPRCGQPLELRPGSRIDLPCSLVCFRCHFEPELRW